MFNKFSRSELLGVSNFLRKAGFDSGKLYNMLSDEFWDRMLNGEDEEE